jgi:peptidoglycan/LPS O-acetylase OafA/YrhL
LAQTINKNNLVFLDGLRGIAAFYVMVGHARWLLWEGLAEYQKHPNTYSFGAKLVIYFLSLFKYGHEMVLFFFVLSGFVIHLRYAKQIALGIDNGFDFLPYTWRRFKRIYPPFLAAIILGFCLDYTGQYLDYSIYNHATPNALINNNISIDFSVNQLVGNLLFLQNTYVPVWGSNTPLWSLKFEWWFYMLYPLLFFINRKSVWLGVLIVFIFSICILSGLFILPVKLFNEVIGALFCWWLGTLLADIYTKRVAWSIVYFSPFTILVFCIPFMQQFVPLYKDLFCAIGFFGLLSFLFFLQEKGIVLKWLEKLQGLGGFSYTLYVIHFPILVLMSGYLLSKNNNQMPHTQVYVFIGITICSMIAYALHFITEKWVLSKTNKVSISSLNKTSNN